MRYTYDEENREKATVYAPVFLKDARHVVFTGRELLACFERYGTDNHDRTQQVFNEFHEAIYGAGFVMSDFDGPLFDRGPARLMDAPGLAAMVARASNLMTLRMFIHTIARSFRHGYMGYGYSPFSDAYLSGGLRGVIERIDEYCKYAERHGKEELEESDELNVFVPVAR